MNSKKIISIDFDDTADKFPDKVNKLYSNNDYFIIIYTARKEERRIETEKQLKELGIGYHLLIMNKLRADVYIDNKNAGGLNWQIQ